MAERLNASGTIATLIRLLKTSGGLLIDAEIVETVRGVDSNSPAISVNITGEDAPLFVRNQGELLGAVHHVAAASLNLAPEEQSSISFDVDNLMAKRKTELQQMAGEAVARVHETSQPYAFAPMISCERHMLHLALASSGLKFASHGDGTERRVVLYPEGTAPPDESHSAQKTALVDHRLELAWTRRNGHAKDSPRSLRTL